MEVVRKVANLRLSRKRINYMGLNELTKHDYDLFMALFVLFFSPLMFYFVNIRNLFPFSLELSKTHSNLADYYFCKQK